MHRPAPSSHHQDGKKTNIKAPSDCSPSNDQTEVHADAQPSLRQMGDAFHQGIDEEEGEKLDQSSNESAKARRRT